MIATQHKGLCFKPRIVVVVDDVYGSSRRRTKPCQHPGRCRILRAKKRFQRFASTQLWGWLASVASGAVGGTLVVMVKGVIDA